MMQVDCYSGVGYAVELLAQSEYHRQFPIGDYLRVEILPPLWLGQIRFYVSRQGLPTGMVTWAWLSDEVLQDVLTSGRALAPDEWNCGSQHFFNDWVTPHTNVREIMHDMTHNVFPDTIATSLRRYPDGSVRRINRWTGVNVRSRDRLALRDMNTESAERTRSGG